MRLKKRIIAGVIMSLLIVVGLMVSSVDRSAKAQEPNKAEENEEGTEELKENLEAPNTPASDVKDSGESDTDSSTRDAISASDAGVNSEGNEQVLLPAGLISNLVRERKKLAIERAEIEQAQLDLKIAEESLRKKIKIANAMIDTRVKEARKELESQIQELKGLKEKVGALKNALTKNQADHVEGKQREKKEAHETKITHLVKLCERMPPESAAAYLEGLEVDVAASVLSRIKVRKAAAIIAAMSSTKAAGLSKRYLKDDIPPAPGIAPKPKAQ